VTENKKVDRERCKSFNKKPPDKPAVKLLPIPREKGKVDNSKCAGNPEHCLFKTAHDWL
jgi:hypothetical protein